MTGIAPDLTPLAPYQPRPITAERARPCRECGAELMREPHVDSCPTRAEILRSAFSDQSEQRLESILADCTRRAFRAWVKAGCKFPGSP